MPDKKGRFTKQEEAFVSALAKTGDANYAAYTARYRSTASPMVKASDPAIVAAVEAKRTEMLMKQALPAAMAAHLRLLEPPTPAAVQLGAVKLTYEEWGKIAGDKAGVDDPSSMTPEQLAQKINALEILKAAQAVDVTPEPEENVFD